MLEKLFAIAMIAASHFDKVFSVHKQFINEFFSVCHWYQRIFHLDFHYDEIIHLDICLKFIYWHQQISNFCENLMTVLGKLDFEAFFIDKSLGQFISQLITIYAQHDFEFFCIFSNFDLLL